ncbi:DUF3226 domain-containing protein [Fusibacter sp. 3D3]|uniref:DUF3226 domain-containing protein n=1 Tax=Fusibacter sp. 3D3 TaxID=1048380 RepID=UPI000853DC7B|nr:DUF3226 domain-containing protein [Fusibacter sp. 3D3]GAU76739.1 hypothetical protein F3D3_1336 [Fusibacter sp. 3D3]
MNKLILCEGKTDAILLSYYLEKTCGWTHRNAPKGLDIKADETKGESVYWYRKENESLLICGVGGKDNFRSFFRDKIQSAMVDSGAFARIAVVTDRDDRHEKSIVDSFLSSLNPIIATIENDKWISNRYENSYKQESNVDFLLVIIPSENEGALETLLLEAISEKEEDRAIVERSISYVDEIHPIASKYLSKNRLKLKAYLGVTWSIQYPEKLFSFIDEQIRSVKWEESKVLERCFEQLKSI